MTVPSLTATTAGAAGAPLLVLGPSLGTSHILWENVVPALAADHHVLAFDLPGHGDSPATTEPFSVGELADAVAGLIRETGARSALYAGVSLGGAIGLELMLRYPDLVGAAAIIASGALLGSPEGWAERAEQARSQSTSSLVIGSAQRWFAARSIEREPVLSGRLLHTLQDADDESYALCAEALGAYDVRDRLSSIRTPVLAVWGEEDQVAPAAKAEEIAGGVKDGRLVMIPDAAHLPPAEQPAVTASVLRDFFEGRG